MDRLYETWREFETDRALAELERRPEPQPGADARLERNPDPGLK
jgi:hypothetical protein